ncbi:putative 1A family penicillin-binding protein [Magnetofaba australis IT-1]|uniref:Penicillin-binding protein 1A n=2 Tax=Magnetofaba TaxID=1472292 RepID=A0A1Y2K548_9PROT|nr:putative 1A family penicillin-binding protein [Magnetofaba australis IT-1]
MNADAASRSDAPNARPKAPKPRKRGRWGWVKWLLLLFVVIGAVVAVFGYSLYLRYARDLPTLNSLTDYQPSLITRVYARDYQLLGEFYIERRQFLPFEDTPKKLLDAVLAIEDSRYYSRPKLGIDPLGIARAFVTNLKAGRIVQGGSTLTQQVAKTFLLSSDKTYVRKLKEAILSYRLEQQLGKDDILELYINQIYLGAGAYGVASASRLYFDRDVSELNMGQIALLAGLPKAPSHYDPWRHPEAARKRQGVVLDRMAELQLITAAEAQKWKQEPLGLARPKPPLEQVAPHYLEHVRRKLQEEWGSRRLYRGGLDVYTSLDPVKQRAAQAAVKQGLLEYNDRHGYRGPLEELGGAPTAAAQAKWRESVAEEPRSPSGYYKALTLSVSGGAKGAAKLLLADGKTVALGLPGVKWAREQRTEKRYLGPTIKRVSQVLKAGDVVLLDIERRIAPPAPRKKGDVAPAQPNEPKVDEIITLAQEPDAEAALVSLDPHTGQVLAMVGGYDFAISEFNRATQGRRLPGSSFKPIVYATAMANGYNPTSRVDDSPMPVPYRDPLTGETKIWKAENYERVFYGPTTLRVALEHSRNLVTIRLLKQLGIDQVVAMADRFGLTIPEGQQELSLALGTIGFSPLQMASAYAVFANGGKLVKPVYIARVQDPLGRTVYRHGGGDCLLCHQEPRSDAPADLLHSAFAASQPAAEPPEEGDDDPSTDEDVKNASPFGQQVISSEVAYQVTSILKGVITHGTGRRARVLNRPVAGKTGTTNDLRDAWFLGFAPSLVTAVWVGRDDYKPLGYKETGSRAALPIWTDYMKSALADQPRTDFPVPDGIYLESVDGATGGPLTDQTKRVVLEAFKKGDVRSQGVAATPGVPSWGGSVTPHGAPTPGASGSGAATGGHVLDLEPGVY